MSSVLRAVAALTGSVALVVVGVSATTASAVPSSASGHVTTVNSCSQDVGPGQMTCFAMRRTDIPFKSRTQVVPHSVNPALTPSGYGPSSLQSAYNLPSATAGSGQRVYVVDAYDDPNAESDLAAYRAQYGLPACTTANGCFRKLNQNGQTSPMPTANTGWAGEISLDLDMASAICPLCGITLIEATNNGTSLYVAVKEAATLGAKYVSMSWGGGESSGETTLDASYFSPTGVVYAVSSGDNAYRGGVEYPASSRYVVSVGGTSLTQAANARGWSETVWKTSSSEGAGSGCSAYEPKPSWQSVISNTVCARRAVADVSAVADPATGVAVYQTYGGSGWTVYGGTSAAAPIVASTYALANAVTSSTAPASLPYANTASLYDVTTGNNGTCSPSLLCTAAAGWDGPTGLGTPNGTAAFGGTGGGGGGSNTVTVTNPGAQSGTVGTAVNLAISASDSGGAALTYSATGLPPGLSINASTGVISGTPTTAGSYTTTVTATDTTSASGNATFGWSIASAGGTCTAKQLLVNPGFESGNTVWSTTPAVINSGSTRAHSGTWFAWLDGYSSAHTDTLAQTVSIQAGCHATLSYYLYIASSEGTTAAHDTLTLTANGTTVQSFSNVNKGTGYALRTVDLSAFAGQSVTIKWTGVQDASLTTSFFIDDTALNVS